ncbi:MAG: D-alanine--D-alanine ligase [Planctomycetota bacterium]
MSAGPVVVLHNAVADDADAAEEDVLVQTEHVTRALCELGFEVTALACTLDLAALARELERLRPRVCFNLVESLGGSDSLLHLIPALLDSLHIRYTGAGVAGLLFSTDKPVAKDWLRLSGHATPDWYFAGRLATKTGDVREARGTWIIKAAREHASMGITDDSIVSVTNLAALETEVHKREERLGRACLAERFVDGREFNVSLLCDAMGEPHVLPIAEIVFADFPSDKPRIVGYRAKWDPTSFEYDHTVREFLRSDADRELCARLAASALACWRRFDVAGFARVDYRVDAAGTPWVLEINANPCLSPDAGFAAALTTAGIPFPRAVARIVAAAEARRVI